MREKLKRTGVHLYEMMALTVLRDEHVLCWYCLQIFRCKWSGEETQRQLYPVPRQLPCFSQITFLAGHVSSLHMPGLHRIRGIDKDTRRIHVYPDSTIYKVLTVLKWRTIPIIGKSWNRTTLLPMRYT